MLVYSAVVSVFEYIYLFIFKILIYSWTNRRTSARFVVRGIHPPPTWHLLTTPKFSLTPHWFSQKYTKNTLLTPFLLVLPRIDYCVELRTEKNDLIVWSLQQCIVIVTIERDRGLEYWGLKFQNCYCVLPYAIEYRYQPWSGICVL